MADKDFMGRLVEAWGEISNPKLDSSNPRFGSKYTSLSSLLGVIRPVMAKHSLMFDNPIVSEGTGEWMYTRVQGDGCEMYLGRAPFVRYEDPQKNGSSETYSKRQSLQAAFGLAGEEDDDGNAASAPAPRRMKSAPKVQMTEAEKAECARISEQIGNKRAVFDAYNANGMEGARALLAFERPTNDPEMHSEDQKF